MVVRLGKCDKIRHIVRLRQMIRGWRTWAVASAAGASRRVVPADVPAGHVAVCVGSSSRRFVVRAAHLGHPAFRALLDRAEEEYGFAHPGPVAIPCDETLFEEVLRCLDSASASRRFAGGLGGPWKSACSSSSSCCQAGVRGNWHESRPLLQGLSESAW